MFLKSSPIPSLELYEWCFVAVPRHHSTSARNIEVGHRVCCLTSVVVGLLTVLPLAVACGGAVEVCGDVAVALLQNMEIGNCSLRRCILDWWPLDSMWDLTAFTPIQVFTDMAISLSAVTNYWPEPVFNLTSSNQWSENLHFPMISVLAAIRNGAYCRLTEAQIVCFVFFFLTLTDVTSFITQVLLAHIIYIINKITGFLACT